MGRAVLRQPDTDFSAVTAPIVVGAQRRAFWVWGAFALALTLAAVPVFSTVLPPLVVYPNHLARMHLLAVGGDAFYAVRWAALPNLAEDLIVPPLARLVPLDVAAKLFLVMIFALTAGGAIWLNRVASGGWRLWPLLAFLFLYNRIFLWGFLNYLFGVGVALCGAASWLALEGKRSWLRILSSSVAALACYFSHVAAFGFYALVILGLEAKPAAVELRARRWPALGRRLLVTAAQFVMPVTLLFGGSRQAEQATINYGAIWRKADLLFSVVDNYDRMFDITCFALFVGLIGVLAWVRRLGISRRLAWATGIVFVIYLLLPSQIWGGSGTDHRLPTALFSCLSLRAHHGFQIGALRRRSGSVQHSCLSSAWGSSSVSGARQTGSTRRILSASMNCRGVRNSRSPIRPAFSTSQRYRRSIWRPLRSLAAKHSCPASLPFLASSLLRSSGTLPNSRLRHSHSASGKF